MSTIKVNRIENTSTTDGGIDVDSSGRVGVNTATPGGTLDVKGASSTAPLIVQGPSSEFNRIDDSGRLLVGTSSWTTGALAAFVGNSTVPSGNGVVNIARGQSVATLNNGDALGGLYFSDNAGNTFAEIVSFIDATPGSGDYPGRLVFSTTANGNSSPTERMRIKENGMILIEQSFGINDNILDVRNQTNTSGARTYGSSLEVNANTASSYHFFAVTQTVSIWGLLGNGTTTFSSDITKKKNVETTRDGYLEDLNKLRVVKYHWHNNEDDNSPKELGLIAQEVEKVFPGLVHEVPINDEGETVKNIKGSVFTFMLIKALQESTQRIETLEAKVAALEAQ